MRDFFAKHWLRTYPKNFLLPDITAGLVVAVMLIPQAMAYALLAGLPAVTGLYASTIPLMVYALLGSSRQLAVGPVAIVSLLSLSGISKLAPTSSAEFIALAALLALLVGVIQAVLGLIGAGFITNFLSHAVISGFTSAAAIIIGLSQLKQLFGVDIPRTHGALETLFETLRSLPQTNGYSLALGLASMGVLLWSRARVPRFPAPLLVVALSTIAVAYLQLQDKGVAIVAEVPSGFPSPALPLISFDSMSALLPTALTIAFVSFMESIAVATSIARKEKYPINANGELLALGFANIAAALFKGYPVTGGFSRTAVNYQAGAKSPLASLITALLVAVTLLFFTPLFYYLPKAVLASIILVAVYGLIDLSEARHLFRVKAIDGWTLLISFAATLVLGVETGILVGIAFSLLVFIRRSAYPHTAELGYIADRGLFRNVQRFPEAQTFDGVMMARVDSSLYFANMAYLANRLQQVVVEREGLEHILLDFSAVNDMDAIALEVLGERLHDYQALGIHIYIVAAKGPVRDLLERCPWHQDFRYNLGFTSLLEALQALQKLKA